MTENEIIKHIRKQVCIKHGIGENCNDKKCAFNMAIQALEEIQQYRVIGTVEDFKSFKEKLQGYKNQMSIYAEQHKVILASDVLDMLEELDWSE